MGSITVSDIAVFLGLIAGIITSLGIIIVPIQKMLKNMLWCTNVKIPIGNNHKISGKQIAMTSNLICIENTLSTLTCTISNMFHGISSKCKK